jgi:hypothetical protein
MMFIFQLSFTTVQRYALKFRQKFSRCARIEEEKKNENLCDVFVKTIMFCEERRLRRIRNN